MTCNECQQELPARALGGLPELEASQLDEHLAGCADCRQEWDLLSHGLPVMNAWQIEAVPSGLSSKTMASIEAEAARPTSLWARIDRALHRFASHRPTPLTGLATVCVTLLLLSHVLSPNLFRGRSSGDGSGCQRNLKVVTQALESYSREHQGLFPDRLEALRPDYLKELPDCPDSGHNTYSQGYQVSPDHRSYTLLCSETP